MPDPFPVQPAPVPRQAGWRRPRAVPVATDPRLTRTGFIVCLRAMTKSDIFLIAANVISVFFLATGLGTYDEGFMSAGILAALVATIAAAVAVYNRRSPISEPVSRGRPVVEKPAMDIDSEMDPHSVLDLDARLEALEQSQHDAVDAARWRALVESGQITAPASDAPTTAASGTGPAMRNGR